MTKGLNHHENGLRQSARLSESREKKELQMRKAHTTYGNAAATKVYFDVFSLFALASSATMPNVKSIPQSHVIHAARQSVLISQKSPITQLVTNPGHKCQLATVCSPLN